MKLNQFLFRIAESKILQRGIWNLINTMTLKYLFVSFIMAHMEKE